MFFVGKKPVALTTSCSLDVTTNEIDSRTKDSANGDDKEFDFCSWSMNSDSIVGASADSDSPEEVQVLADTLLGLQLSGELVEVAIGRIDRPAGGGFDTENPWEDAVKTGNYDDQLRNFGHYSGKARIMSVSASFPDNGQATCSVKCEGRGPLTRIAANSTPKA